MKPKVLFLCTGNSCRSQMAEGFLRHWAGDRFEVASAGTHPSTLNPEAVAVMQELGIDISSHHSKDIGEFLGQHFTHVITVCDRAKESCPIFPGATYLDQWSFEDPAAAQGPSDQRRAVFHRVRDEIADRVRQFIDGTK